MMVQANHLEKAQSLYTDYLKKLDAVLAPPYQVQIACSELLPTLCR